jgi:hypothetical protein
MRIDELWQQVMFAIAGGLAAEILHFYMLSRKPGGTARYRQRRDYWLWTIGMIAIGGLMPALYIEGTASALLCFHLGAATPLLMQKLVTTIPEVANPQGESAKPTLKEFFTW